MKKKLLALFLCCVMVFSLVPVALTTAFAAGSGLQIYGSDGALAETVQLEKSEKTELTAVAETGSGNYQWQIHVSDDVWANIVGTSGNTLELSYGLVANALDNDAAEIRCKLTNDVGNVSYSNIVTVQIHPDSVRSAAAASSAAGTVISEAQPVGEPVIVPADTPAGFSAPAPVSDPASADDPAPVNDTPANDVPADETPANDTPTPTTYAILINYQFTDGRQAAPSWSATVATGSTYVQDIQSPVVVGYTPSETVVHVEASEAKTYTVTYQPAEVEFTVKHYQQNVSNDEYTLTDTETKKGFTESAVGEGLAKTDYTGFYSLLYDTTTTIAADGSTVVEVYYDRYYYLMNFDLDGGYGVEPIYARFGAPISVDTPTKPGYTFAGWDKTIPTTMPAKNETYAANWTVGDSTKVTVVIWGENPDDEKYSYINSSEIQAKPGTTLTKDDLTHILTCDKEEHQHTNSCGITCGHVHNAACYGGTQQEAPIDGKTGSADENIAQFKNLTGGVLENGKIYRVRCNAGAKTGNTTKYDKYYLYFNETWYLASDADCDGAAVKESGDVNAHGHSGYIFSGNDKDHYWVYNAKLSCVHTHTDSCYICGKAAHKHNANCYTSPLDMDATLWKLVKSDEVTVAADGSSVVNVYYDRTEKTLTFKYNYDKRNGYQSTETITAKWGSNISEQYKKIAANAKSTFWSAETSGEGPYTNYFGVMPQTDATYYNRGKTGDEGTMTYWGQDLNGEYTVKLFEVTGVGGYTVTDEDRYEFEGFTYHHGTSNGTSCSGATFYYTRNSYNLTFNDGYNEVKKETVKYEAPLNTYSSYGPKVPSAYEAGSVTFDGWYLNPECTGVEYMLNDHTMPADNVLLYAKWVPVIHTVSFYLDRNALEAGTKLGTHPDVKVSHGSKLDPTPKKPENGSYTFVGWFYLEDGVEKAFDFANMPVTKDMKVYGKWSSNVLKEYTIYYKYKDADGNEIEIAAPTTGSALAGSTKTFDAKTGTQLNEGYQSGYFPKVSSHSITIDIEGTAANKKNEFTFVYVAKPEVEYTVKYLEKGTGNQLAEPKTVTTRDAVVTETFKQITGYAPDAYQKQLVLAAENNVIIFWYVKDDVHAPVRVIHWQQNIEGDGYTERQSSTNLNGVIGKEQTSTALEISGFQYVKGTAVAGETTTDFTAPATPKAILSENGLVLNLYYDRIEYPYEFRFVEKDSNPERQLADPVTGSARYQAQVTQNAKIIPGYTLASAENQAIHIAIEDGETVVKNVKIFYYTEQTVDIKYEVVGPTGCGTLDNYQETQLKVTTGEVKGSAPTAAEGFKFVGWYKDEACMQPVDAEWVNDSKLTPGKTKNYGTNEAPVMGYEAATYYAKFEYDVADLTITKKGWEDIDEGQSFIFDVTDPNGYSKRVVVNGNGSVTIKGLKIGTYTVKEVTSWSWRYTTSSSSSSQNITLKPAVTNEVIFENTRNNHKWLGGDAYKKNTFTFDNKN